MGKIKVAAKALVLKHNKILLLKRNHNQTNGRLVWDIPGGGIEAGESFEQALHREVREETGLEVEIIDAIRAWEFNQPEAMTYGVTFLAKYISGEVQLSEEHDDCQWIDLSNLQNLEIDDWIKDEAKIAALRLGIL